MRGANVQNGSKNAVAVVLAVGLVALGVFAAIESKAPTGPGGSSGVVPVVAAENFWGSLIAQLGGVHVSVTSIVSDPNADPHEYEANATDARLIANARLVVENGEGYDAWCDQLIASAASPHQTVLNVQSTVGAAANGNPHFWYDPSDVNATVHAMYADLVAIDPGDTAYFQQQYASLNLSLGDLYGRATEIKEKFAGTEVAATEDIFTFLANFTGLDLVSPPEFMAAIAEGNDPPAQSVVEFQRQLESGNVSVLVYNLQTLSPITDSMRSIAAQHNVSIVGVTETIQPPDLTFQAWMGAELVTLENALESRALGR